METNLSKRNTQSRGQRVIQVSSNRNKSVSNTNNSNIKCKYVLVCKASNVFNVVVYSVNGKYCRVWKLNYIFTYRVNMDFFLPMTEDAASKRRARKKKSRWHLTVHEARSSIKPPQRCTPATKPNKEPQRDFTDVQEVGEVIQTNLINSQRHRKEQKSRVVSASKCFRRRRGNTLRLFHVSIRNREQLQDNGTAF